MNLLCSIFGLWCATSPPVIVPHDDFYDLSLGVTCPGDPEIDAGPLISERIKLANDLWWTTSPQSDAAGASVEGASIAIMSDASTCYFHTPFTLSPDHGTTFVLNGGMWKFEHTLMIEAPKETPQ